MTSGAQPGAWSAEGFVLVASCWCAVLAAGLLPPVLPQITREFAAQAQIDLLVGLIATVPSLTVAVLALPIGAVTDRLGPRIVLLTGLVVYAIAGMAPFWLDGIWPIIGARAVAGVGEGCAMIGGTTLLSSRFAGERRQRLIAAQISTSNMLGIVVLLAGGYLGLRGWREPFLAYGAGLVLFVLALRFTSATGDRRVAAIEPTPDRAAPGYALRVTLLCALEFLAVFVIFAILVQLAYLLPLRGATDSAQIGWGIACGAAGIAGGAAGSALARTGWRRRATAGFALSALGLGGVAVVSGATATCLLAAVAGVGAGVTVPTLLSVLVANTPGRILGRIVSVWTIATFAAQFLNPPLFVALRALTGGQPQAILAFAVAIVPLAGGLILVSALTDRRQPVWIDRTA